MQRMQAPIQAPMQGPPQPYYRPMGNQGNFRPQERPQPVLGQQPPLPGTNQVPVRYVQPEEPEMERALVPSVPYYKEPSSG